MNHRIRISIQTLLFFASCLLMACTEDKGNYTYETKTVITIDSIADEISVLANAEYIDLKPVITSNIEGVIEEGNPNFEFTCMRAYSDPKWVDMNPEHTKDIHLMADMPVGTYLCYYAVTDKRTNITTYKTFNLKVVSTTYEGWMVLCNEGSDERVRLDMLAQLSSTRYVAAHDVIQFKGEEPVLYHAASLGLFSNQRSIGNKIVLMSQSDAYILDNTDLSTSEAFELKKSLFASANADHIVNFTCIPCYDENSYFSAGNHAAILCVSEEGNAFVWNTLETGAAFEDPVNTSVRGGTPEYKVAPFVGASLQRSSGLSAYGVALLYDETNHRFIGWDSKRDNKQTCYPLEEPAAGDKKFNFHTGSMSLVAMLNTAFSQGVTYCIMQDGAQRHIYAINVTTNDFVQVGSYENISAPDFDKATCFAASSQYPVIYYAYRNKVYAYYLPTGTATEAITLDANEEVTLLKFNMYDDPSGVENLTTKMDEAFKEEFTQRQFELIVGAYDNATTDNNGGILRFYKTSSPGTTLSLKPGWEYSGYAKIKDVKYKEVRP